METQKKQIVLIVDDSLLICEQIKAALKDTPIFICEAHNGQEAVDMVENYQPDLILLDVVLPDADGYSLFDKLKKAAPLCVFCLKTAAGWKISEPLCWCAR